MSRCDLGSRRASAPPHTKYWCLASDIHNAANDHERLIILIRPEWLDRKCPWWVIRVLRFDAWRSADAVFCGSFCAFESSFFERSGYATALTDADVFEVRESASVPASFDGEFFRRLNVEGLTAVTDEGVCESAYEKPWKSLIHKRRCRA